ncbi:5174_t:CDS:2, partial [Rhizophagus irregularis]
ANLEDNDENVVIVSTDEDINGKLEEAFKLYNLKFNLLVYFIVDMIQTFEKDNSFE